MVTLEKRIEGSQVNVDDDLIETICIAVRLTAVLNTQGYQVFFKTKEEWVGIKLKVGINPEKYGSRKRRTVSDSLTVIDTRPKISREVQMMVVGLPFNAPDSVVHEQVELFGGKVKGRPSPRDI